MNAGTFVVGGEGTGLVEATGGGTRLAEIAELIGGKPRPQTPLARELRTLVRTIALLAITVGIGFFVASLLLGLRASAGFLFAIGVTVALVPEGLLPTVTLSLAVGARRMAARGALVRRLEAVEALGSTTFICTDKTGTLTENRMSVVEVWTPGTSFDIHGHGYEPVGEVRGDLRALDSLRRLALSAARCSTGRAIARSRRVSALQSVSKMRTCSTRLRSASSRSNRASARRAAARCDVALSKRPSCSMARPRCHAPAPGERPRWKRPNGLDSRLSVELVDKLHVRRRPAYRHEPAAVAPREEPPRS